MPLVSLYQFYSPVTWVFLCSITPEIDNIFECMLWLNFNNEGLPYILLWQDAHSSLKDPECHHVAEAISADWFTGSVYTQPEALTCRITACLSDREPTVQTSLFFFSQSRTWFKVNMLKTTTPFW